MFILGMLVGSFGMYVIMAILQMCKDDEGDE